VRQFRKKGLAEEIMMKKTRTKRVRVWLLLSIRFKERKKSWIRDIAETSQEAYMKITIINLSCSKTKSPYKSLTMLKTAVKQVVTCLLQSPRKCHKVMRKHATDHVIPVQTAPNNK
jgi:dihydroorotate dehydrogenase